MGFLSPDLIKYVPNHAGLDKLHAMDWRLHHVEQGVEGVFAVNVVDGFVFGGRFQDDELVYSVVENLVQKFLAALDGVSSKLGHVVGHELTVIFEGSIEQLHQVADELLGLIDLVQNQVTGLFEGGHSA